MLVTILLVSIILLALDTLWQGVLHWQGKHGFYSKSHGARLFPIGCRCRHCTRRRKQRWQD